MRLYYLIWVDCIIRARSQPSNKNNWRGMTMMYMTISMAVDLLFLMTIFEKYILNYFFYEIQIPWLPQSIADPLSFAILYAGPPLIINYVLIFRNRRYEKLIKEYEYHDGKLFVKYIAIALFVPVIVLWAGIFYGKI
jgi:hypothetical protein